MKAKIKVFGLNKVVDIVLDTTAGIFTNLGKKVNKNVCEFMDKLLDIVVFWDEDMTVQNIIDAESYLVEIENENKKIVFKGCGRYPENYEMFIKLIGNIGIV